MNEQKSSPAPIWAKNVLKAAAIYNLVWGGFVIAAPTLLFRLAGMDNPRYPQIWQCVGMIVGVYGMGYWLAARDPFRHWPIVVVGFLGKIFGPIGFLFAALSSELPWSWGITILTNDLIWWIPFAYILFLTFRHNTNTSSGSSNIEFTNTIREIPSQRNATLSKMSLENPTLVVFLRHSGCTFCRETLADLAENRWQIERAGVTIAIVHMGTPMDGTMLLRRYGLEDVHYFSDPQCVLYRAFALPRGSFGQLFSANVVMRASKVLLRGHGFGRLAGDGFRLAGAFLLSNEAIVRAHRTISAADRINLIDLIVPKNSSVSMKPTPSSETRELVIG